MRLIPKKMREEIAQDPFMRCCIYERDDAPNQNCQGRITFEHAFIYAGRQINEKWAIVPCCENHNSGPAMVKSFNKFVALNRASEEDLAKYPKVDWVQLKKYLTQQYEQKSNTKMAGRSQRRDPAIKQARGISGLC